MQCWLPVKGVVTFISSLFSLKLMESVWCAKAREFMKDTCLPASWFPSSSKKVCSDPGLHITLGEVELSPCIPFQYPH